MHPDTLATADEVFSFARIPTAEQTDELRTFVEDAVCQWTVHEFGTNWKSDIQLEKLEHAARAVKALVTLDVFPMDEERRVRLQTMVRRAAFDARGSYQVVRHYLRRHLPEALETGAIDAVKAIAEGIKVCLPAKGEFNHFDEIKDRLAVVREQGADVRVLKGADNRLDRVARELQGLGIPCRTWSPTKPAVRYYRVGASYLLLLSHGGGDYSFFGGLDAEAVAATKELFELDWQNATAANDLGQVNLIQTT